MYNLGVDWIRMFIRQKFSVKILELFIEGNNEKKILFSSSLK